MLLDVKVKNGKAAKCLDTHLWLETLLWTCSLWSFSPLSVTNHSLFMFLYFCYNVSEPQILQIETSKSALQTTCWSFGRSE